MPYGPGDLSGFILCNRARTDYSENTILSLTPKIDLIVGLSLQSNSLVNTFEK